MINNSVVIYRFKKQSCVSRLSTESEIYALADSLGSASFGVKLCNEVFPIDKIFVKLYSDNFNALGAVRNGILSSANRHMRINLEYVRSEHELLKVLLIHTGTSDNVADVFTKLIKGCVFVKAKKMLKVKNRLGDNMGG
jgi:hypothetical protein